MRFKFRISIAYIAASLIFPPCAFGQDKVLKSEVSYSIRTAGGETAACVVDTMTVIAEETYKKGAKTGIRAIFVWKETRGNLGLPLKVTGLDFHQGMQPTLFKVTNAFMAVKGVPSAKTPLTCEDPLSFCGVSYIPQSLILFGALSDGNLSVGFNREPGGLDTVFPIDGSLSKAKDQEAFFAFQKCMTELMDQAVSHNPK